MVKRTKESFQSSPQVSPLRRTARALLAVPVALWIFVEEWLWDRLLVLTSALAKLPPIRWAETRISKLPSYLALIAFLIPVAMLLPFKLAAFWLIAQGKGVLGTVVFIVAKIVGTVFLARIFALTKPALMTIGWFARSYMAITSWKLRLYDYVRALPVYQAIRQRAAMLKRQAKIWWWRFKGA
jgi:hypothetical protein